MHGCGGGFGVRLVTADVDGVEALDDDAWLLVAAAGELWSDRTRIVLAISLTKWISSVFFGCFVSSSRTASRTAGAKFAMNITARNSADMSSISLQLASNARMYSVMVPSIWVDASLSKRVVRVR